MKPLKLILILQILFFISSCFPKWDKTIPDPILPPETQEGKGTFACKINGKVYVDDRIQEAKYASYDPILSPSRISWGGDFTDKNGNYSLIFYISLPNKEKIAANSTYFFKAYDRNYKDVFRNYSTYFSDKRGELCNYDSDSLQRGSVTITKLDWESQVVSGRFQITFIKPKCTQSYTLIVKNDTITITEGVFEVNYTY